MCCVCGNGCATAYRNWWKPPPLPASLFLSKILNKLLKSIKTHKSEHTTGNRRTRFTTRREILKEKLFQNHSFFPPFFLCFHFFPRYNWIAINSCVCTTLFIAILLFCLFFSSKKFFDWCRRRTSWLLLRMCRVCV